MNRGNFAGILTKLVSLPMLYCKFIFSWNTIKKFHYNECNLQLHSSIIAFRSAQMMHTEKSSLTHRSSLKILPHHQKSYSRIENMNIMHNLNLNHCLLSFQEAATSSQIWTIILSLHREDTDLIIPHESNTVSLCTRWINDKNLFLKREQNTTPTSTTESIFLNSKMSWVSSVVGARLGRHSRLDPALSTFYLTVSYKISVKFYVLLNNVSLYWCSEQHLPIFYSDLSARELLELKSLVNVFHDSRARTIWSA